MKCNVNIAVVFVLSTDTSFIAALSFPKRRNSPLILNIQDINNGHIELMNVDTEFHPSLTYNVSINTSTILFEPREYDFNQHDHNKEKYTIMNMMDVAVVLLPTVGHLVKKSKVYLSKSNARKWVSRYKPKKEKYLGYALSQHMLYKQELKLEGRTQSIKKSTMTKVIKAFKNILIHKKKIKFIDQHLSGGLIGLTWSHLGELYVVVQKDGETYNAVGEINSTGISIDEETLKAVIDTHEEISCEIERAHDVTDTEYASSVGKSY
jgi:hypothetical protein